MILNKVKVNLSDYFYEFECFEFSGTIFYAEDPENDYVVYFDNWDVLTSLGDRVPISNMPKYVEGLFDFEDQPSLVFFKSMDSACDCIFKFASSNFVAKVGIANALAKSRLSGGGL